MPNNAQPAKDNPPRDAAPLSDSINVRIVLGDSFNVRLGSGGGGALIHQPVLLGRVSNPSVNGQG